MEGDHIGCLGADTPSIRDGEDLQERAGQTARCFAWDGGPGVGGAEIRALPVRTPTMAAAVLAERVGWTGAASPSGQGPCYPARVFAG